jgi:hypothetical protein
MKKSILIIVILSIAALCFAGPLQEMHKRVIAGSTVAGGEACTCTSAYCEQTSGTSTANMGGAAVGQSFQISEDCDITYIDMYITVVSSGTATLRIGNVSEDLSVYLQEVGPVAVNSTGYARFTFSPAIEATASTTYWFGAVENSGGLQLTYDSSNVYAYGSRHTYSSFFTMGAAQSDDARFMIGVGE